MDVGCKVSAAMDTIVGHLRNVGQGLEEDFVVGGCLVRTNAEVALAVVIVQWKFLLRLSRNGNELP